MVTLINKVHSDVWVSIKDPHFEAVFNDVCCAKVVVSFAHLLIFSNNRRSHIRNTFVGILAVTPFHSSRRLSHGRNCT